MYPRVFWGHKQTNEADITTNFIYETPLFVDLMKKIQRLEGLAPYAVSRWYNYWSAMGVEHILTTTFPNIVAEKNKKSKYRDFFINGMPFDHKTSVFPFHFPHSYEYARQNTTVLLNWLYENQSPNTYRNSQTYKYPQNRLYIILYDQKGEHWKLRSELKLIYNLLQQRSEDYIIGGALYKVFWLVK